MKLFTYIVSILFFLGTQITLPGNNSIKEEETPETEEGIPASRFENEPWFIVERDYHIATEDSQAVIPLETLLHSIQLYAKKEVPFEYVQKIFTATQFKTMVTDYDIELVKTLVQCIEEHNLLDVLALLYNSCPSKNLPQVYYHIVTETNKLLKKACSHQDLMTTIDLFFENNENAQNTFEVIARSVAETLAYTPAWKKILYIENPWDNRNKPNYQAKFIEHIKKSFKNGTTWSLEDYRVLTRYCLLLKNFSDNDNIAEKSKNLLTTACIAGNETLALDALACNCTIIDTADNSVLLTAIKNNLNKVIEHLLKEHTVNTQQEYQDHNRAIDHALQHCSPNTIKLFVDNGFDITSENSNHYTIFHEAAWCGTIENVSFLLQKFGKDFHHKNSEGLTPLDVVYGREKAELLLEHGAQIQPHTLARQARESIAPEKLKILLEHELKAIDYRYTKHLLTKKQPSINNTCDTTLNTALHYVMINSLMDDATILDLFYQCGANFNQLNKENESPLALAAFKKDVSFVEKCIQYGADPRQLINGFSVVHYALANNSLDAEARKQCIKLLVEHGAPLNTLNINNNELFVAVQNSRCASISFLAKRINLEHVNAEGKTILQHICQSPQLNLRMLTILCTAGADTTKVNINAQLPQLLQDIDAYHHGTSPCRDFDVYSSLVAQNYRKLQKNLKNHQVVPYAHSIECANIPNLALTEIFENPSETFNCMYYQSAAVFRSFITKKQCIELKKVLLFMQAMRQNLYQKKAFTDTRFTCS